MDLISVQVLVPDVPTNLGMVPTSRDSITVERLPGGKNMGTIFENLMKN